MSQIEQIKRRLAADPIRRALRLERALVDGESRTAELAFASDKPVGHWFGDLILDMSPGSMRSERLSSGAPLLMDHNPLDQIGVIEDFSVGADGVARATVRFSRSARAEEVFQDVVDGIRQSVSVGFMINELELVSERAGETPLYRSRDWTPYEVSLVSIPADISVGVGRSADMAARAACPMCAAEVEDPEAVPYTCPECGAEMPGAEDSSADTFAEEPPKERGITTTTEINMNENQNTPAAPAAGEPRSAEAARIQRNREIVAFGEIFGEGDLARSMVLASDEVTLDDVRTAIAGRRTAPAPIPTPKPQEIAASQGVQLARALPRHGVLRNFSGTEAAEKAYRFGMWVLAGPLGRDGAKRFCEENGLLTRTMQETVNTAGGYLVPDEFGNDLIDLREQYGVFRRNAKIVPMMSDTRSDPRRIGGLTAYFVGESDTITASDKAWDRVNLVAKKLGVVARYSSELSEDAAISLGDDLAGEIAYAFALKEDECGFNGDGSATYGNIVGAREKIKGLSATIANIAGLQVGTGNAYSELTLADFEGVVGRLPQFADTPAAKWFVHRHFYYNVMVKVMLASGGVTAAEVEGARTKKFLGYDVEFTQVMPKAEANSQVCALLGDLALAASMGSRRDTAIALSEHSRFATDEIEIRGTERFDINVHSVGNADATAANQTPGPIVGLITAAS